MHARPKYACFSLKVVILEETQEDDTGLTTYPIRSKKSGDSLLRHSWICDLASSRHRRHWVALAPSYVWGSLIEAEICALYDGCQRRQASFKRCHDARGVQNGDLRRLSGRFVCVCASFIEKMPFPQARPSSLQRSFNALWLLISCFYLSCKSPLRCTSG